MLFTEGEGVGCGILIEGFECGAGVGFVAPMEAATRASGGDPAYLFAGLFTKNTIDEPAAKATKTTTASAASVPGLTKIYLLRRPAVMQ